MAEDEPLTAICSYEDVWTDEVGTIPVCKIHGNNSRHDVTEEQPHPPCLTLDPYPDDPRFTVGTQWGSIFTLPERHFDPNRITGVVDVDISQETADAMMDIARDELGFPIGDHTATCGCKLRGRSLIKPCEDHRYIVREQMQYLSIVNKKEDVQP